MRQVTVSAYVVSWPSCCPCCLGPADARAPLECRVHGGPEMSIPICRGCLRHSTKFRSAELAMEDRAALASRRRPRLEDFPATGRRTVGLVLLIVGLAVTFALPCLSCAAPSGETLIVMALGLIAAVLIAAIGFCLVAVLPPQYDAVALLEAEEDLDDRLAKLDRFAETQMAEVFRSPGCMSFDLPVTFVGWHGNTRTFQFTNPRYEAMFCSENQTWTV